MVVTWTRALVCHSERAQRQQSDPSSNTGPRFLCPKILTIFQMTQVLMWGMWGSSLQFGISATVICRIHLPMHLDTSSVLYPLFIRCFGSFNRQPCQANLTGIDEVPASLQRKNWACKQDIEDNDGVFVKEKHNIGNTWLPIVCLSIFCLTGVNLFLPCGDCCGTDTKRTIFQAQQPDSRNRTG